MDRPFCGLNLPKGLTASLVLLHMVLQWCRVTLAQTVDVQYGQQIIQLVVGSEGHGLPYSPFRHFSIPQQTVHVITAKESKDNYMLCILYRQCNNNKCFISIKSAY